MPDQLMIPLRPPQAVEQTTALVYPGAMSQTAAVILAHGAGTDMRHHTMQRHAEDLSAAGHAVALFNFGYTELGRRGPDPAARLESAWRDVTMALHPVLGMDRPLVIGGRSMGGRIASMVAAADGSSLGVAGVICLAYPLHPPGRQEKLRVSHWPDLTVPILLLCGSRDSMAPTDTLDSAVAEHMPAGLCTLHVLKGADHSFRARKKDGRTQDDVFDETASAMTGWLGELLPEAVD